MAPDPLVAVRLGLAVFPVEPNGKKIGRPDWQRAATTDPQLLARIWRSGDNIGIGCWRSNVVGLDLDVRDDRDGLQALAELVDRHGQALPPTLTIRTPSGGLHTYYRPAGGVVIGSYSGRRSPLGLGIDIRGPGRGGRGGYLVGPDSIIDGRTYTIIHHAPIAPVPVWLAERLALPAAAHLHDFLNTLRNPIGSGVRSLLNNSSLIGRRAPGS
jgi:hypothetical protein